ncbi:hypothetical protein KIL84_010877 [Mauremys mutica]|uniref:Uncharacterized protein n=1 Tax=Mauremys mutica TaxID=74926 RepID=A0A9D3XDG2_9SAUR|nr:hypothetical protein KIL84_010877 [Mauremys mutica]
MQWLAKQQEKMQKALQAFQQPHQLERQALLAWQAEQQKSLQDFIREQAKIQQQLLHRLKKMKDVKPKAYSKQQTLFQKPSLLNTRWTYLAQFTNPEQQGIE